MWTPLLHFIILRFAILKRILTLLIYCMNLVILVFVI